MKKIILVIIGLLIIIALIAFNHYTRTYFDNNDKIIKNLNSLKQKEIELNYEVLSMSVYLYKNFDEVVKLESQIDKILNTLSNDEEFKSKKYAYKKFLKYKNDIQQKINNIYELETIIAPIKNSNMYIAELVNKLPTSKIKKSDRRKILYIASQIFLLKNSFDLTFAKDLHLKIDKIKGYEDNKLYFTFIKNIELFDNWFPLYVKKLNNILNYKTQIELESCIESFLVAANQKLEIITIVSILLILFVVTSILIILLLFFKLEKENEVLEKITITDSLTNLFNRRKLELDLKADKNDVLFIVNIDRFKYYNDFYGVEIGDYILQQTANHLKKIFPVEYNANFYRIGADDFAILFKHNENTKIKDLANLIIDSFKNNSIIYKELEFHIFVSIGISTIKPLLETADIALKTIKKDKKQNIGIYNPSFREKEKIEENITKTTILKEAIDKDLIIPYFQPIFSNKTGEIVKYEVLARIKNGNKVMSIYPFLVIAKENKVYKYITQTIYKKAFDKFRGKNIEFSLNISIDDINNEETMDFIYKLVEDEPEMFKYITFEILEDDAIKNYDLLKEFIDFIKLKGSKIAIDDFGSGYSNFSHVLNLDIDFLKIDGSLIKNLDHDKKMELIVGTIVEFSNKTNMHVIAEYVHSKAVLEKVKELNIEYSQGFYLGEPKGDIE